MEDHSCELSREEYIALATFRNALRSFLHFSAEAAKAEGLTPQQHQLLLLIKGNPKGDGVSVSELADGLKIHHNAAVGLVNRCELAGLVQRSENNEDRRQVDVSLTPLGVSKLLKLTKRHIQELHSLRSSLDISSLIENS